MIVTGNKIIGADRPKEVRRLLIPRRSHPGQSWAERDEAPSMAFRFACESLNLDPARLLFLPSSNDTGLSSGSSLPAFGLHHP